MEKSNEFRDSLNFPLKLSGFSIHSVKVDENWEETSVSSFYEKYLKLVIFCFYSLALVLWYWDNLKPAGASMKAKSWITLAQHFIYIEQTLATFFSAAREDGWQCDSFDRFLVMELVVKRHEPIYVYAYRASRKDGQPNISTYPLDRLSECSLFFPIPNWSFPGLDDYIREIGEIISGDWKNFRMDHESRHVVTARTLLKPLLAYYSNSNRVLIGM